MSALTRRDALRQAGAAGLAAPVASAIPFATHPAPAYAADVSLTDATLQAFADTILPGRKATRSDLGDSIHPLAIAGVDAAPGAVETDALALFHHPEVGFDTLAPAFLGELEARSLLHGGDFLDLGFDARMATCLDGLDYGNPTRLVWEAAAAVPFTCFCAAALVRNATAATASGYRVMGLPGVAPTGYRDFSYARPLSREQTSAGSLP